MVGFEPQEEKAMRDLSYHDGQRTIQQEAGTVTLADRLGAWHGPIAEFSAGADLFLFAHDDGGTLRFTVLSGPPPMVEAVAEDTLAVRFPAGADVPPSGKVGALAVNLGLARRARVNGTLTHGEGCASELRLEETFTLCRKYLAPSVTSAEAPACGPLERTEIAIEDPWLVEVLGRAETTFLASIGPSGMPDVAHRGGPPGFVTLDPATRTLAWPEFVGDGIFKSAGNVRSLGRLTLLALDIETGDGVEFIGKGAYRNVRTQGRERLEPLLQFADKYPLQGEMTCHVERALRLTAAVHPRQRIEKALKVTSQNTLREQSPL
jgi:hypothetical protein